MQKRSISSKISLQFVFIPVWGDIPNIANMAGYFHIFFYENGFAASNISTGLGLYSTNWCWERFTIWIPLNIWRIQSLFVSWRNQNNKQFKPNTLNNYLCIAFFNFFQIPIYIHKIVWIVNVVRWRRYFNFKFSDSSFSTISTTQNISCRIGTVKNGHKRRYTFGFDI